ncbi:MAG: PHP domain-containing protein [Proteobacteria bacterium]|nr:PHP domain-containing protein [Pseudomonadota bacterium]
MLSFERNKLVHVGRKDEATLHVRGVLSDDIYSLEIEIEVGLADLAIDRIEGKWHRWTTPECPRADAFLREALGFRLEDADFSQKVHKIVGRKSCRHYANLLLECAHSAKEASRLLAWEAAKADEADLKLDAFLKGRAEAPRSAAREPGRAEAGEAPPKPSALESKAPSPRPASGNGQVIDLHVHTHPASSCSSAPVDEVIQEARRIGLDGICLTDHNHVWAPDQAEALRQRHGFLVLRGNEITTEQGDMLVFGLEKDIKGIILQRKLRQEVDAAGGCMIVAHPFRGFLVFGVGETGLTPEQAMDRPLLKLVDAIEIMNGKVTVQENEFAAKVAAGIHLPATGGSDAHEVVEVGKYATRFFDTIRNEQDLIAALKSGACQAVAYRKEKGLT